MPSHITPIGVKHGLHKTQHKHNGVAGRSSRCSSCNALPNVQQLLARISGQPKQLELVTSDPKLTQWLQERGYEVGKQKVIAQQIAGQGRGLVATAAVRKGECLVAVPQQLVIFPHTAARESSLAPLLEQQAQQLPDWSLLALFLAEQLYWHKKPGGGSNSSNWGPYIGVLPCRPIGTVLDWTPKEVDSLLAGSGLRQKAATILSAAEALWQDLQPLIRTAKQQGLCPSDMFSRADIDWAVGICLSRSVRLDDRQGEVVLVPFADLLNHSTDCDAYLVWEPRLQSVVLRPDRSYKPGEQVFISYGPKSSGELLLSYGFCPPPGSNPHDAAHLTVGLEDGDPLKKAKQAALAARDIPAQESFAVRIDSLPAGLIPYLAFCAARPKTAAEVEGMAAQLFDEAQLPLLAGVSCEAIALEALAKLCRTALKGYLQKQDTDRQLAADVSNGGGYEQRQALCASLRLRDRQILSRTEFVARQRVKQLSRGS